MTAEGRKAMAAAIASTQSPSWSGSQGNIRSKCVTSSILNKVIATASSQNRQAIPKIKLTKIWATMKLMGTTVITNIIEQETQATVMFINSTLIVKRTIKMLLLSFNTCLLNMNFSYYVFLNILGKSVNVKFKRCNLKCIFDSCNRLWVSLSEYLK